MADERRDLPEIQRIQQTKHEAEQKENKRRNNKALQTEVHIQAFFIPKLCTLFTKRPQITEDIPSKRSVQQEIDRKIYPNIPIVSADRKS